MKKTPPKNIVDLMDTLIKLDEQNPRLLQVGEKAASKGKNPIRAMWWYSVLGLIFTATALVAALAVALCLILWPVALISFWELLVRVASDFWGRIALTIGCFCVGILLYVLRRYFRAVYGIAELLVGTAVCWVSFANGIGTAGALSLAGGLYVIVRACDNIVEGYRATKKIKEARNT